MRLYGEEWRKLRRVFQQAFKSDSSVEYRPIQTKKMHDLLYGLLQTQDDLESHVHTWERPTDIYGQADTIEQATLLQLSSPSSMATT